MPPYPSPAHPPPPVPPGSMLPKYARHVERNPETLLTRFYGVHRVKPSHGRKVGTAFLSLAAMPPRSAMVRSCFFRCVRRRCRHQRAALACSRGAIFCTPSPIRHVLPPLASVVARCLLRAASCVAQGLHPAPPSLRACDPKKKP